MPVYVIWFQQAERLVVGHDFDHEEFVFCKPENPVTLLQKSTCLLIKHSIAKQFLSLGIEAPEMKVQLRSPIPGAPVEDWPIESEDI